MNTNAIQRADNITLPTDILENVVHHSKILCASSAKFNVDIQRLSKNNAFSLKDLSDLLVSLNRFFASNCELLELLSDYQYELLKQN